MTRAASAPLCRLALAGILLLGVRAAGLPAAEPPDRRTESDGRVVQFRRLRIPADQIVELTRGYMPMKADEFQRRHWGPRSANRSGRRAASEDRACPVPGPIGWRSAGRGGCHASTDTPHRPRQPTGPRRPWPSHPEPVLAGTHGGVHADESARIITSGRAGGTGRGCAGSGVRLVSAGRAPVGRQPALCAEAPPQHDQPRGD